MAEDAPKYINFSRGDVEDESDTRSEAGESSYSIAQFSRPGNYRRPSSASKSTYSEATENGNSARRRNSTDSKTDRESTPGRPCNIRTLIANAPQSHSSSERIWRKNLL